MTAPHILESLNAIATYFLKQLEHKKYILLFAYNGTGKTRLSMDKLTSLKTHKKGTTQQLFPSMNEIQCDWASSLTKRIRT